MIIKPQDGPQTAFLATSADIALYGGAAFGGKSWALLTEPLRHVNVKGFTAVIFRRTVPELTNPGGLWDESKKIYGQLGAIPNESKHFWRFTNANEIKFGNMQYEKNLTEWFGSQIAYIGFDELTSFTRRQFFEMLARNRSTSGVAPYVRASCNPDPDSWVLELVDWYIDKIGNPIPERSGVIRWFIVVSDSLVWGRTKNELIEKYPGSRPKSFTFVPAKLTDNKIGMAADPGYQANLMALPAARRAALLDGNWRTHAAGKLFQRAWFADNRVEPDKVPDLMRVVVGVDPSGGHGPGNDEQGIFTCGKGRDGFYYVIEDSSCKLTPAGWATMACRAYWANQADCIAAEKNYGGEMVDHTIKTADPRVTVKLVNAARGKAIRAEPIAALCQKGKVKFVGVFPEMENEAVGFDPNENAPSPNRLDAFVWAMTELVGGSTGNVYT